MRNITDEVEQHLDQHLDDKFMGDLRNDEVSESNNDRQHIQNKSPGHCFGCGTE